MTEEMIKNENCLIIEYILKPNSVESKYGKVMWVETVGGKKIAI